MQSLPSLTTGHDFLHSCLHFLGLHFSALTMAMRVRWSPGVSDSLDGFFLGGMLMLMVAFSVVAVDMEALVQCWRLLSLSGYEAQDNI